ncbi:sorting nexin-29-like isoform X2 [Ornithodoros turicata]|uniref:sorting nexin-29-like isoform X2 n=1 Tax=Ornithodoros turicata TaxID=34597 RepID=UPI0031399E52
MSREDSNLSDRQILLSRLLDAVKQCQIRFGGRQELATEGDGRVVNLCTQFEAVLQHGMKKGKGISAVKPVSELVKGLNLWSGGESEAVFWHFVRTHLTRHELERYLVLKHVVSDQGRGRAWLRSALNEHSLERYMHMLVADPVHISQFYEDWSFLMDQERSSMLPTMSAGLGSILFAINIDNPALNPPTAESATHATLSDPQPVVRRAMGDVKRKKKKRKPRSNVVSFDEDDLDANSDDRSLDIPYNCFSAPATCLSSPICGPADPAVQTPTVELQVPAQTDDRQSMESLSQSDVPTDGNLSDEKERCETAKLSESPSVMKSWCNRSVCEPQQELSDSVSSSPGRDEEAFQSSVLTPVLDASIGDLIPVNHEGNVPSSDSIPSYSDDTESAAEALAAAQNAYSFASSAHSTVPDPCETIEATTMTTDELKNALLAVTLRFKTVEEENGSLRRLLERESEVASSFRAEAEETKKQCVEKAEKQESKIQTLSRENELLRHQLKKYIFAVQLLKRDGIAAHQALESLVGEVQPAIPEPKPYVDHQYEASEYEKKLVQVAEMHGELMEFNERLQKLLLFRETTIRRLREELTDLRGPLPDENQTSDDDISITSDYDASSQSAALRPLINIWIPSAFFAGHCSDAFHVYQVYIRIRDDEWNVYRRYSQFYALHKTLRKKNPIVNSFDFPPKKSIGNKDAKVVEERRKRLQRYLRCVLNWMTQTNPDLLDTPDKHTLVTIMPFFKEQDSAHPKTSRRAHPQRLRIPGNPSASTLQPAQQQQHPVQHYTGL